MERLMLTVTVTPRADVYVYGLLVKKEVELRKSGRGTLRRRGDKRRGTDKWVHSSYPGWIRYQQCLGGVAVATIQSKTTRDEWQLLSSFVGFLDRHFRSQIRSVTISYPD